MVNHVSIVAAKCFGGNVLLSCWAALHVSNYIKLNYLLLVLDVSVGCLCCLRYINDLIIMLGCFAHQFLLCSII